MRYVIRLYFGLSMTLYRCFIHSYSSTTIAPWCSCSVKGLGIYYVDTLKQKIQIKTYSKGMWQSLAFFKEQERVFWLLFILNLYVSWAFFSKIVQSKKKTSRCLFRELAVSLFQGCINVWCTSEVQRYKGIYTGGVLPLFSNSKFTYV